MSPQTVEKGKAPGWRPEAPKNVDLRPRYGRTISASRANQLEGAAGILLLMLRHRLTPIERTGYMALFQRRLRQAYEGGSR
jgi:hypothetical protein